MQSNQILERLPKHLQAITSKQDYESYTFQDHAVWRYVMRRNIDFMPKVAHSAYLDGLKRCGLDPEMIPSIDSMNEILQEIGWAAISVDGFIPPSAFMEFQRHNVLVIATDIRTIDQIEYTPSPDIIHEAAGHAPIMVDEEYAAYLKYFGEIGSKAFSSAYDFDLYEAIRHLSILKADPNSSLESIDEANVRLNDVLSRDKMTSEMELIRNLHWWTVEYGLVGSVDDYKIYGAGLLSSIGEAESCLDDEKVIKLEYTLAAKKKAFDITNVQPQLYVTKNCADLMNVLKEYVKEMAISKGGMDAIEKAIDSKTQATMVWSSGLQVCGIFTNVIEQNGLPIYLNTAGPTNLNYNDSELLNHGVDYHKDGFSSPIGLIKGSSLPLEDWDDHVFSMNESMELDFESGVRVIGKLKEIERKDNKIILLSFEDCTVTYKGQVLFAPEWGTYDMAVGKDIISGFNGVVDPDAYHYTIPVPEEMVHKIEYSESELELHRLYGLVRAHREGVKESDLDKIWNKLATDYKEDWLLPLEILCVCLKSDTYLDLSLKINEQLNTLSKGSDEKNRLIQSGLRIMELEISNYNQHG